jgi:ATP-dependent helicase/nuclease subunit A
VLEGVIDLLYRLDGQVWIADYKTDRVTPVELEARAERYRPQAEAYKAAVLQALGGPAVNFQFVFLRVGRAVRMS